MTVAPKPPLLVRSWRYFQRHGIRGLASRVLNEFRTPVEVSGIAQNPALPSSGLDEIAPESIYSHLDAPLDGAMESSAVLRLTGWAAAGDGVVKADAYVDGAFTRRLTHGLTRADVAEYLSRVPGAESSGFTGELDVADLLHGAHLLEVVIEDRAGHRTIRRAVFHTVDDVQLYRAYYEADQPGPAEIADLARQATTRGGPAMTIWVDGRGAAKQRLERSIASIAEQQYPYWTCAVIADALPASVVGNDRFSLVEPSALFHTPAQPGSYSAILEAGETLSRHALLRLGARAFAEQADVIYSDRDTVDDSGSHAEPWFNPDWSDDYLLARNYVGGFFLFRDDLRPAVLDADTIGGPAWRFDLLLRLTDGPARVAHDPHIEWSAPIQSDDAAREMSAAELAAVDAALARRGASARVEVGESQPAGGIHGIRRVRRRTTATPLVSIIVPTTGKMSYVEPFLTSLSRTSYASYELIVLDNSRGRNPEGIELLRSSGATIIERDEDFNWAKLNNDGARAAQGELLLFLNDDIEIVDPDWLTELAGEASRPEIGAVGALLLYPDGRIQHGGVFFVGYGGGAMHLFQGMDPNDAVYLDLHRVQREVSAVTGACLMVKRASFEEIGGFDERLEIAGNDVDLCLRLIRAGHAQRLDTPLPSSSTTRVPLDRTPTSFATRR